MRVYIFDADINNYQAYLHATQADLGALSEVSGQPLANRWGRVSVLPERESRRRSPLGDCPGLFLGSCVPGLSQRAVEALSDFLAPKGRVVGAGV